MSGLLVRDARVLTLDEGPPWPRRGADVGSLGAVDGCDVLVAGGVIASVGRGLRAPPGVSEIDARGRVVMPAFVDCHTHACWAGDRLDEWEAKLAGAAYLDVLGRGGGIMSTVRAVRAASEEELARSLSVRLARALREGTLTIEIKSGYGLETETELRMLRAIRRAGADWPGTVVPNACIGHAIDGEADAFVERTIGETLDAVHEAFPGIAIDAYCELGAWSLHACVRLAERALALGHPVRIHADQFNALGMTDEAVRLGLRSVDHLEATPRDALERLARSETYGVMLPCTGMHLDGRYADGRAFLDAGGRLAIASNWNPGSAPCGSMPMTIALAVRHLGLTPAQAIGACTGNAASLLGLADRGRIRPGLRADLLLLSHTDERQLAFEFGPSAIDAVICAGRIGFESSPKA